MAVEARWCARKCRQLVEGAVSGEHKAAPKT